MLKPYRRIEATVRIETNKLIQTFTGTMLSYNVNEICFDCFQLIPT